MKKLLTGNEAVALAVIDEGALFASAYPGTPSTEILENLAEHDGKIYAEWAPNEKTALEGAFGASLAGVRSIASMKHVGLNVAADPFFTVSAMGVNAGLVIVDADEPGMFSSQNEQDNRRYAYHANIAMLEPADSQQCYDMVREAYNISETYNTPVLIRMTTRVCHSKSLVETREAALPVKKAFDKNPAKFVAVPANAKVHKVNVLKRAKLLSDFSEGCKFNSSEMNASDIGIVASGICTQYAREVFGKNASYFDVGFSHPMPLKKIADFAKKVKKLYVIEENDPVMETQLKAFGIDVTGKEIFPANDELTPDVIRASLGQKPLEGASPAKELPGRAPALCAGCPHRGIFYILGKQKNVYISGDIGCYALGCAPPFKAMDSIVCMGASVSAAHGAAKAFEIKGEKTSVIAVLGDSTFFHTGIPGLINIAYNGSKVITFILDNRITGMTGHQDNPGTGYTASKKEAPVIDIAAMVKTIGIKNVVTVDPNDLSAVEKALEDAYKYDGPSVIITRYPCVLKKISALDKDEFGKVFNKKYAVDKDKCIGCKLCIGAGCPAVSFDKETKKSEIDENACVGCSVCAQICPKDAIVLKEGK